MNKLAKAIEKAREDKVEGPNFMKELNPKAESQNVMVAANKLRHMYLDIDLDEAIRMIENAQRVNNSSASAIIQRLDRLSEIVQEETTEEIQGMTVVD